MDNSVALMFGLPGQGMHFRADPITIFFLCVLIPQVIAAAIAGMRGSLSFWVFVLGMGLTLLAADAFTLVFGFELMSAASWLLVLRGDAKPAPLYIGIGLFSGACLIPAVFLSPGNIAFALILLGAGAKAGLAPLHFWLPRAHPAPPAGVSAVMSGGMVKVALYVIIRYGFVVFGNAVAPWWGEALVIAGAASVLLGSFWSFLEPELKTMLAYSTVEHVGLIAVGLGLALHAKALGDPALAALALQAALFCILAHGLFKPLLFLGAGAVKTATGTSSLNALGGLMRGMPRLGALMLVGAAGMAALPFGAGFAPEFLLLHSAFAAAASGGIVARIGFTALLVILGVAAALSLSAVIRLIGLGFLGRPRSLHVAAAEDAPRAVLGAIALLGILCALVGLLPGLVLLGLNPVVVELVPGAEPPSLAYAPLLLLCLGLVPIGLIYVLFRRFAVRGTREVPAWNGGFGRPPAWLPFGDPFTQPSGAGFSEPVRRAMGRGILTPGGGDWSVSYLYAPALRLQEQLTRLAEYVRRATVRQRLAFVLGSLVLALFVLGLAGGR